MFKLDWEEEKGWISIKMFIKCGAKKLTKWKFIFARPVSQLFNSCNYPPNTRVSWGVGIRIEIFDAVEPRYCKNKISLSQVLFCPPFSLMYESSRLQILSILQLTDLPLVLIFHCRLTMVSGWHLWRIGAELLTPLYIYLGE